MVKHQESTKKTLKKAKPQKTTENTLKKNSLRIVIGILILGVLAGVGGSFWYSSNERDEPEDFNIILITIDALRPDHLSCYGYQKAVTSHIDLLAKEGILFQNALANAPNTYRSFASLVSSQYPETVAKCEVVETVPKDIWLFIKTLNPLPPEFPTLAQVIRDSGWNTLAVLTNPLLGEQLQITRGFEKVYHADASNKELVKFIPSYNVSKRSKRDTHFLTTVAMELIESHKDAKFFFWVHYIDPHMPYGDPWVPPYPVSKNYRGPIRRGFKQFFEVNEGKIKLSPEDVFQLEYLYDRDIEYVDKQVGRLIDYLKKAGLWENSLVILSADHGEQFYEHGETSHVSLYWETIRVPLIVKLPGESTPQTVTEIVELIDLAPTILEMAGLAIPSSFQGKSFAPLLKEGGWLKRLAWKRKPFYISSCNGYREPRKAIRDQRYTMIYGTESKTIELFDRKTDPGEQKNIFQDNQDLARDFLEALEAHLDKVKPQISPGNITPGQIDEKRLRALGYIK